MFCRLQVQTLTSLSPSAAPSLGPEQNREHKAKKGEHAGHHVDHEGLLGQLGCVREGGGGGQGGAHRRGQAHRPVRVAHAVHVQMVILCQKQGIFIGDWSAVLELCKCSGSKFLVRVFSGIIRLNMVLL